jgi:hypothetical protein
MITTKQHVRGHLWQRYSVTLLQQSHVKRFNFSIVSFLVLWSNILLAPAYGVYISQLIRYSKACGSYQDFLDRGLLLTRKLLDTARSASYIDHHLESATDRLLWTKNYHIRRVWRYQRGNQNPYIEEEQTTQYRASFLHCHHLASGVRPSSSVCKFFTF